MNTQDIIGSLFLYATTYVALFAVLVGAAGGTILLPDTASMQPKERWATQLIGWMLVSLLMVGLIQHSDWGWVAYSVLGLFMGIGSAKVLIWLLRIWKDSDGIIQFLGKLGKIRKAVRQAIEEPDDHEATK